ncbi:fumarylacetoacetate hydrolase family protein [Natronoglomus mannanivorans]|uniref:Fumarylacetoacetate hydrolase family protein n=1 Tax=Natronoglomus mannanivorans TaxID=2979990 RepID=A0AAP2YXI3_9EURY|nr:fumarylacetoacetate hydrolase family protein [Halobacteria archaeon AArc-xg1-1]
MRSLARTTDGEALLGDETGYVPLSAAAPGVETIREALTLGSQSLPEPSTAFASRIPAEDLSFASPLPDPGKLLGIGLNYADHAADLDERPPEEPASFFKPTSAATGPGGPIRLPPAERTDHVTAEAELAVVVGRTCRDVDATAADAVIAGYLPVIDVTAEDVLRRNPRFLTRAKSFDTFLVFGPHIAVPETGTDLSRLEVRTVVNGEVRARNTVDNMHVSPRELVAFHSRVMTLEPGDIISTGTPGAHVIRPSDEVRAEVDRFGSARADVVAGPEEIV